MLDDVLRLTGDFPARALSPGELLFEQGDPASTLVVLVDGELVIEAGGVAVNRVVEPGSFVGEIGALLGTGRTATVVAGTTSTVRELGDPIAFFASHSELGLELARQLAGRVHRLTTYVSDVQRQFADRDDHLGVFGELLHRIASRPPASIDPGSDRSPDY